MSPNYFKALSSCKNGGDDSCQYVTKCQPESSKRDKEDAYYDYLALSSSGGGSKKRSRRRSKLKKRSRRRSKLKKRHS